MLIINIAYLHEHIQALKQSNKVRILKFKIDKNKKMDGSVFKPAHIRIFFIIMTR